MHVAQYPRRFGTLNCAIPEGFSLVHAWGENGEFVALLCFQTVSECARASVELYTLFLFFDDLQLRREARLRREYLYRKSIEDREKTILERKRKVKEALEGGRSS